jgi:hypothetical protein
MTALWIHAENRRPFTITRDLIWSENGKAIPMNINRKNKGHQAVLLAESSKQTSIRQILLNHLLCLDCLSSNNGLDGSHEISERNSSLVNV